MILKNASDILEGILSEKAESQTLEFILLGYNEGRLLHHPLNFLPQ